MIAPQPVLNATVHAAFAATAARTPDAGFLHVEPVTAQAYDIAGGAIRWADARRRVASLRRAYREAGYGHGHRVGLLLDNRPDFLFHWFALNALGVSVVPMNPALRAAELAYLIGHSEMVLAVCLARRRPDLEAAAREAGTPLAIADATFGGGPADALAGGPPQAQVCAPLATGPIGPGTECALLYTSGTTGRPKGCMLDNAYYLRAGEWYARLEGICRFRRDGERIMTPLPLDHVNAMAFSTMAVVVAGGCLVQLDRFHPRTWLQSARESRATIIHYLGVMPAMLLAAPPSPADRDHCIAWGFGAGVDRRHHAPFEARFGFPLVEAWAMTETGAGACVMAHHEPRHVGTGCIGRSESFVDIRVIDDEGGDAAAGTAAAGTAAAGTAGELLVRSAGADPRRHFFSGYLKDEAATRAAWAGGWFHTGDIVRRDGEGNLFFVDRRKNVIRRSGENISAVEVESVLNQHPAVQASAVAATPDRVRGDEVLACVVLRAPADAAANAGTRAGTGESTQAGTGEGTQADTEAAAEARARLAASIVEHALDRLAYFKAPGYVAFVDALPLTASQKIQRGELRELASRLPADGCCVDTRALKKRRR